MGRIPGRMDWREGEGERGRWERREQQPERNWRRNSVGGFGKHVFLSERVEGSSKGPSQG